MLNGTILDGTLFLVITGEYATAALMGGRACDTWRRRVHVRYTLHKYVSTRLPGTIYVRRYVLRYAEYAASRRTICGGLFEPICRQFSVNENITLSIISQLLNIQVALREGKRDEWSFADASARRSRVLTLNSSLRTDLISW